MLEEPCPSFPPARGPDFFSERWDAPFPPFTHEQEDPPTPPPPPFFWWIVLRVEFCRTRSFLPHFFLLFIVWTLRGGDRIASFLFCRNRSFLGGLTDSCPPYQGCRFCEEISFAPLFFDRFSPPILRPLPLDGGFSMFSLCHALIATIPFLPYEAEHAVFCVSRETLRRSRIPCSFLWRQVFCRSKP